MLFSFNLEKRCWNYISPSIEHLNGYSADEMIAVPLEEFFVYSSYQYFIEQVARRQEQFFKDDTHPHVNRDEVEINCKNGATVWCDVTTQCNRNEKNELTLTGVARRIRDAEVVEESLSSTISRHHDIINSIEEGYYETDLKGRLIFFNEAAYQICGYTRTEFSSIDYKALFKDPRAVIQKFKQVYRSGQPENGFVGEIKRKDGSSLFVEMSISPMRADDDTIYGFRGVARDITERIIFQQQLEYQSMHDQLTGLYNRNYFEEELRRLSKSRDYPITMISADVNGLKLINDTMGHERGDYLLKMAAEVLNNSLRGSDVLARVGGDEFTAILLRADQRVADKVIKRIRSKVREYNEAKPDLYLSLSLGSATADTNETTFQELFKKADDRMYRDKLAPSSRVRGKIVKSLLAALDKRDYIAGGHGKRLSRLCRKLGKKRGLTSRQLNNLTLLSQVHDLGKVAIPEQILFKAGPLDEKEWQIIREHPEKGYRIALSSNYLAGIAGLILRHHECWDGSGYPLGLKGVEIPVECRILAIVDAFDAMTNHRPYYHLKTNEEALEELMKCAGTQFDPDLCAEFVRVVKG